MKRYLIAMLGLTLVLGLTGCGDKGVTEAPESAASSVVSSDAESAGSEISEAVEPSGSSEELSGETASAGGAADVLNAVWNGFDEDNRFPAYGGDVMAPVDSAAGSIDVSDKDTLTYTLLIPEELQGNITEGATLIHFMNANTFTGAALKLDGADPEEYAKNLKDAILNAQFMCGFPERLVVVSYGDYVLYAFGADDFVIEFEKNALANLEGAKTQVNELF